MRAWSVLAAAAAALPAGARAQVTFTDVTLQAGIDHVQWDGVVPEGVLRADREMLFMTGGVAAADLDGDGWCDLYVTRAGAPNLFYRNLGLGRFADVAAERGVALDSFSSGCACGDIDNDGDLDIYVLTTHPATRNRLYVNDGTGRFAEEALERGVALRIESYPHRCTSAAFGDYDRDGYLDLFVAAWQAHLTKNVLFHNEGDGTFRDVTGPAGLELREVYGFTPAFADYDADGWQDLFLAADFGTSRLYRNLHDGTFIDLTSASGVGTDENGMGSAIGDMDGDGRLDWFVTAIYDPAHTCDTAPCTWGSSGNRLYRNAGGSIFFDWTDLARVRDGGWGWGASFLDFDNDGDLDLAMANGIIFPWIPYEDPFNDDTLRLWCNDGLGIMAEVGAAAGFDDTRSGKGIALLDFDRDGDLDVYVANNADRPVLYRNDGGNASPWLQVRLVGHASNAQGIGARVRVQVEAGGPVQVREATGGSNFMSQNEAILHFGLGPGATSVHRVRVDWPASGLAEDLEDVPANRRIVVEEPPDRILSIRR